MATEVEPIETLASDAPPAAEEQSDQHQPILEPILGERWKLGWQHVAITAWFGVFFLYISYQPLFHTDLWGHVGYGKWMLTHRTLPTEDPFVSFATGIPTICSAWLGQVLLAAADAVGGPEYISHLFAITVLATYVVLFAGFYVKSGQMGTAFVATWFGFWLVWSRHGTVRTEMFATLSYAVLFFCFGWLDRHRQREEQFAAEGLPAPEMSWTCWLAICGGVFLNGLFWGNVHGSFLVGIAVLGCQAIGRVIEVAWTRRDAMAVLTDRWVHRWLLLTELAFIAALINPYGIDSVLNALEFGKNPNLPDVLEWKPLPLRGLEGIQMLVTWVLLMVVFRHSRQRVRPVEVLLLALFSVLTIPSVRMIGWYGFAFAYAVLPHVAELGRRFWNWLTHLPTLQADPTWQKVQQRSHMLMIGCIFAAWVSFALSHVATPLLGGEPRKLDQLYSKQTPRGVTEFLRQHPPSEPIWNPQWWGDWLVWDGPKDLQVFMTTNAVHLAPHRYWQDYLGIARGATGWQKQLDKYNVATIVIHKSDQPQMDVAVRNQPGWTFVYEDELAVIVSKDPVLVKSVQEARKKAAPDASKAVETDADATTDADMTADDAVEQPSAVDGESAE